MQYFHMFCCTAERLPNIPLYTFWYSVLDEINLYGKIKVLFFSITFNTKHDILFLTGRTVIVVGVY